MAQFVEVSRVRVSDSTELVISQVVPEDDGVVTGINLNTYVTSPKYTGFTKGLFIPTNNLEDFKKIIAGL